MFVRKNLSIEVAELKMEGDSGRFGGYASVFGGVDAYGDTILRGAFESTLRKNGKPKMFYNHDWHMPIGKYNVAREDEKGLWVEGEFTPGMNLASEVRAGMQHGTIDGLSIAGYVKKGDYDETEQGRVIRRWADLIEVSPVVFPADGAARVDAASVKFLDLDSAVGEIETIRDFERFLRDAGGLSKGAAVALVARAKVIFAAGEPSAETEVKAMRELRERIARFAT